LVGFGVSNLVAPDQAAPAQQELFADLAGKAQDSRNKKLDQVVDALRQSFGSEAIKRGKWAEKRRQDSDV
jgi:hypothetical protein